MMRCFTCVAMLVFITPATAQTPREIVDRAIQAHGGSDVLAKTKAMVQVASGRMNFQGVDVEATREGKCALPDRVAWTVEFSMQNQKAKIQLVMNGLSGWQAVGVAPPTDLSSASYDTISDEAHVHWLCTIAPLSRPELKLAAAPAAAVDGQACVAVKVMQPGKPDTTLYFHRDKGLLLKASFRGREPGGPVEKEFVFSEHKELAGIQLPMKVMDYQKGMRMGEWKVKEYRFVDKFEPNTFKKP